MKWLKQNNLIFSIIAAVIVAFLTPNWGAKGGYLRSEWLVQAGIIFIFLNQGFSLSTQALIDGIKFWPLHVFTQSWIFLGVPIIALSGLWLFGDLLSNGLKLGIFYLSILPTTITSAVFFVSHGNGNVAGSIFNTVFANLSAVFILPIWVLWYQKSADVANIEIWPTFIKLIKLVLIPFIIGHTAHSFLNHWEKPVKKYSKTICQCIIVFILYAAFATSFKEKVWSSVGMETVLFGFIAGIILLASSTTLIYFSARLFFHKGDNQLAAFITSSQKSLAVGIPYAATFFSNLSDPLDPSMKQSIVILPLLIYHPTQLFLASLILRIKSTLFSKQ